MILIIGNTFEAYKDLTASVVKDYKIRFIDFMRCYPFISSYEQISSIRRFMPYIFLWDAWQNPDYEKIQQQIKLRQLVPVSAFLKWPKQKGD